MDPTDQGVRYAERIAEVYRDAELRILERITAALSAGLAAPDWEVQVLGRLQGLREQVLAILQGVNAEQAEAIREALAAVYGQAGLGVLAEVGVAATAAEVATDARALATSAIAGEMVGAVSSALGPVLRASEDVLRGVVAEVVAQRTTNAIGRREATQLALQRLAAQGLRAVQTRRGVMDLPTYVEMAVRTGTQSAAVAGHLDQAKAIGLNLVAVQPGPRACRICDRWARMVLAIDGPAGTIQARNARTGATMEVRVDSTVADARAAGWKHPNCRCSIRTYQPGLTRASDLERPAWDAEAYRAQQRQRGIERQIRGWKQREAIAITPEAKREARERIRAWQATMRDHLAQHDYLKRQSRREQLA